MLYWLPRLCLLVFAGVVIGFGLFPRTSQGVAYTLLMIMMGLGAGFRYALSIPAWKTLSAALRGAAICARLRSEDALD